MCSAIVPEVLILRATREEFFGLSIDKPLFLC